ILIYGQDREHPLRRSPAGTALCRLSVSSLRDLAVVVYPHHRTVNKGLSLRDKTLQILLREL
ncbi:MAG: hypothetical protein LBU62_03730, partial [Bacteroidales bacterium]|nr:hypothetical protein [Bacteroidales bacterium]